MKNPHRRIAIGHLAYLVAAFVIIIIILILFFISARQSQLQSEANAEVTYFDTQQPISTQSCPQLISNQARASHDASLYSAFEASGYFQTISSQYLSQIQSDNCPGQ